jgi:phosphate:Na+ symporter
MNETLTILLIVAGGLGTFLLGMKHLSEGLQAVSGKGLRRFMALATTHRLAGVATGCLSTMIVQSSSIITVMAVGFVSSGILNLTQAINVIIGANIGTTVTGWIIAVVPDVMYVALTLCGAGGFFYFFVPRERAHNTGLALLGLGLVFMGLHWMNEGCGQIKNLPQVQAVLASLDVSTVWGFVKCFLITLVFTAAIQSSSAMTAIIIVLLKNGNITFETAAASVFGMNIGTTVTAWLAAIGGTTESKRTAMAHTLFNVTGTVVLVPFFVPVMLPLAKMFFPDWVRDPAVPMAAVHTLFNIITTLLFLPFVRSFARFVTWLVPAKAQPDAEQTRLTYLDKHVKLSPPIACEQAFREVLFMAESNIEMMEKVRAALTGTAKENDIERVFRREDILDRVQQEITEFLGRVMTSRLPVAVADQARSLLRITDELESVSDEECTVMKALRRFRDGGGELSGDSLTLVLDIHDRIVAFAEAVSVSLRVCETEMGVRPVPNADALSEEIRMRVREARQGALLTVGSAPMRTLAQLDILNALDRMRSCYLNVAQTLAGGKHV